ncbi:hypothetical protein WJ969_07865 [Achromobacter xylosoxidans]
MNNEPVNKYFGTPMSEWIARVPNELGVDAVGLWQIIPVGADHFGLSGAELEDFSRRCIVALLEKGAVPVRPAPSPIFGNLIPHTEDLMKISQGRSSMNGKITN